MRNPTRLPERCSRRPSHRFVPVLASAITGVTGSFAESAPPPPPFVPDQTGVQGNAKIVDSL